MKALIDRVEPLVWVLFGGGFVVGTLLFPAYIFGIGIAAPLGWIPADALSYERMHGIASSPIGRLVMLALIVLPVWNAANHLRHLSIDFGHYAKDGFVAPLLYALAALASVIAIVAVVRL